MIHQMNLHNEPFMLIKSKTKTVEMRLDDERRKDLKIGDIICFTNRDTLETMNVEITNLYRFKSFEELYKNFSKIEIGYKENEKANPKDMELYYTKEQQQTYGVVAIRIKLL